MMSSHPDISAIILAAGFSSRMGGLKPLLPLGKMTVLARTLDLFKKAGISNITVVVGYRHVELLPLIQKLGAHAVVNPDYKKGMLSSIKAGIRDLSESQGAFFILPVDIPLVRRQTLSEMIAAWKNTKKQILYPLFSDQRGHPPLISSTFAKAILSWQGDGGLRAFLSEHESQASDVPVADEYILFDMDTPEDYQRAIHRLDGYHIPTTRECMAMMTQRFRADQPVFKHCLAVAKLSLHLTHLLNGAGCKINLALVKAAGLLHDLLRDKPNHAQAAANLLRQMDYEEVADVVESHMDIVIQEDSPFQAREVVYLADKIVKGNRLVPLANRFGSKQAQFSNNPKAMFAMKAKLQNALKIKDRFEANTGKSLDTVVSDLLPTFTESNLRDLPA